MLKYGKYHILTLATASAVLIGALALPILFRAYRHKMPAEKPAAVCDVSDAYSSTYFPEPYATLEPVAEHKLESWKDFNHEIPVKKGGRFFVRIDSMNERDYDNNTMYAWCNADAHKNALKDPASAACTYDVKEQWRKPASVDRESVARERGALRDIINSRVSTTEQRDEARRKLSELGYEKALQQGKCFAPVKLEWTLHSEFTGKSILGCSYWPDFMEVDGVLKTDGIWSSYEQKIEFRAVALEDGKMSMTNASKTDYDIAQNQGCARISVYRIVAADAEDENPAHSGAQELRKYMRSLKTYQHEWKTKKIYHRLATPADFKSARWLRENKGCWANSEERCAERLVDETVQSWKRFKIKIPTEKDEIYSILFESSSGRGHGTEMYMWCDGMEIEAETCETPYGESRKCHTTPDFITINGLGRKKNAAEFFRKSSDYGASYYAGATENFMCYDNMPLCAGFFTGDGNEMTFYNNQRRLDDNSGCVHVLIAKPLSEARP